MQIIKYTNPRMLIADEGKQLREINDVYTPEHIDEEGNLVPEHFPYYSDMVFVPNGVDIDEFVTFYVEENK